MSSPRTFIEDQLARRAELLRSIEMMENHLANPKASPSFGMLEDSKDVTPARIAALREQVAEIDDSVDRMRRGNDEQMTRKKRYVEPPDERKARLEKSARQHDEDASAAEDIIDEMVKRSIEKHGP